MEQITREDVRQMGRGGLMDLLAAHGLPEADLSEDDLKDIDALRRTLEWVMFFDQEDAA